MEIDPTETDPWAVLQEMRGEGLDLYADDPGLFSSETVSEMLMNYANRIEAARASDAAAHAALKVEHERLENQFYAMAEGPHSFVPLPDNDKVCEVCDLMADEQRHQAEAKIATLTAERDALKAENEAAKDILQAGGLLRPDEHGGFIEVPTTLIERAKMMSMCLESEADIATECGANLRAVRAERDSMKAEHAAQWQPIETAPKDGRHVLAWRIHSGTSKVTRWFGPWNAWAFDNACWHPTHWQPLPDPPLAALSSSRAPQEKP